ncbi:tol-pal system-associated acyl-CoA thioesterase [Amaricoccus macauensis]|uniref:tol-pal system-associated acyl-CoA thioesterase n=1 Tax=Amaricoccus macauensis TaxID=57001 RepID=UPI003C7DCB91
MAHEFRLRVYYEDTDAGGVVYHANYLCFAERARSEALIDLGLSQTYLRESQGFLFMVRAAALDYRAPAFLEDELVVRTRVDLLGGARILMRQDICRGDQILVVCDITLVCVGTEGRAARVPDDIREKLATLKETAA